MHHCFRLPYVEECFCEHADFQAKITYHQTNNFMAWRLLLRVSHSFSGAPHWGGCAWQELKWTQYSNRHLLKCSVDFDCLFPIKTLGSTGIPAQPAQRALFTMFNPCRGVTKGPGPQDPNYKFIDTSTHTDQNACRKNVWRCRVRVQDSLLYFHTQRTALPWHRCWFWTWEMKPAPHGVITYAYIP